MKAIKSNRYLTVVQQGLDGGNGIIRLPRQNKLGYIKASKKKNRAVDCSWR